MIERRQRAEGRGQKDRLQGDSDSLLIEDQQASLAGGLKPNKFEGKKINQPSRLCPKTSAFEGRSPDNFYRQEHNKSK